MKSFRSRWAALSMAVGVWGSAGDVRAKEVDLHVEGGMLFGVGIPEMSPRPTVRGDVNIWWAPYPAFNVGLVTGLAVTVLPYGCTDIVPAIGERGHSSCGDGLSNNYTNLPHLMLGLRLLLGSRAAVGAFLGTTFVMAVGVNDYTLYPYPTAGGFVEGRVGSTGRFKLRASLGYIQIPYRDSRGFLAPSLAFAW